MSFFLVTFSRRNGGDPSVEEIPDGDEAMHRFVASERFHREARDGKGVVLLIADDEETLRRTHTHYFATADEILDAAQAAG